MTTKKPDLSIWKYKKLDENTIELTGIKTDNVDDLVIPNSADFNGIKTVYITAIFMRYAYTITNKTFSISATKDGVLTAKDADWSEVFNNKYFAEILNKPAPILFNLNHLNTSNITNMTNMFGSNIDDLTPLSDWDVSNVTNMCNMFNSNKISDLTPLSNWNVSNVTNMSYMFTRNNISDLTPLADWNVANVTTMWHMFSYNNISDLTPLSNWNITNLEDATNMITGNPTKDFPFI